MRLLAALVRGLLLGLLQGLAVCPAHAHKPSDSYLTIHADGGGLRGQWDIALRDLDFAIGLDADGNGEINWGELRAKHAEVAAYALARLSLTADGGRCTLAAAEQLVDQHSDGTYAVLRFTAQCAWTQAVREIEVEYGLFFDLDPTHRGLLRVQHGGGAIAGILSPERARQRFAIAETSKLAQFLDYGREGVWHIAIGIDHVLFLLSLLLPAVFVLAGGWRPAQRFASVFWDVFKVVTAFTVAHSITLSLASLALVQLPSRFVESTIALSVVLAALNNLWPLVSRRRWVVAFCFGLVHGFGFASVLADLGLPRDALLVALVGFNLGVEAGQLAIVGAFLPLAFALRRTWFYRRMIFAGGSVAIALVAAVWMVERLWDLKLLTA